MQMIFSGIQKIDSVGSTIQSLGQNATDIEKIIGVVVLISGVLVGLANVGVSFFL